MAGNTDDLPSYDVWKLDSLDENKCFKCDDERWIACPECLGRGYTIWDTQTGLRNDCPGCLGEREVRCPYCK